MKTMLQQLDTNLFSIDGLIQEQNGKLAERAKVISNNQAEIERLEKRTKMQEHKVRRPSPCYAIVVSIVATIRIVGENVPCCLA